MQIDRRFLYAGMFLLAIGGVVVAADLGLIDTATLTDVLRLWPLAIVAVGVGIVLRRTQVGLASGMLAAAIPGLLIGGAFAVAPRYVGDCGARGEPSLVATDEGTFDAPASVSLIAGCGSITVTTEPGNDWRLAAANTAGRVPVVDSSARSLTVDSIGDNDLSFLTGGRNTWDLSLPTSVMRVVSLEVNAGRSDVDLAGARIERLVLTANASDVVVDGSGASVSNLSGKVRVGSLAIQLPENDVTGSLDVGGGELRLCTPPGLGLRLTTKGMPREVVIDGLSQSGTEWESPDYASATHRADLDVHVNFGVVRIDPMGGCK